MFSQIRWKLVGWNVLVLALVLTVVGAAIYLTLASRLLGEVDQSLLERSREVATDRRDLAGGRTFADHEGYRGGIFYLLVSSDGRIVANPQGVSLVHLPWSFGQPQPPSFRSITLNGEHLRLFERLIAIPGLTQYYLVVGQSIQPQMDILQRLLFVLLAGGAVGLVLSVFGAWFLAGRALVPIEDAFSRQQEFVADASHELRTPLTVLRATTDVLNHHRGEPLEMNQELFDDLCQEIIRLERLATDLLTLARSDLGEFDLAVGDVDILALAGDVVRRMSPLAARREVSLKMTAPETSLIVEGDPDRLQQVLVILLDNALKHTPAGGSISVVGKRHGSDVLVQVIDTGEGIPPEHLPRVLDRFYRVDRARSQAHGGTGLGLPIANSLIVAHHGQLSLSSTLGVGTTVTIRLHLAERVPSFAGRLGHLASRVAHRPLH
ncbi:MAG TPA: ATP-binding protein [Chloroflexota bacterium]|nr:ATP-binding protein [Chloroflexota bacterium]